jgi:Tfp pilus assembly protein PilN
MIEINLVPDVKQELIKAQRIRSMVIAASILIGSISVAVVALLAMYVFTVQAVRSGIADGKIKDGSAKLASVEDLSKTLTIQNQLTKISDLNSKKNIDSRIFDMLTAIIPPSPNDIQISDLTIDSSAGLITIDGQAPNSYAAVEVFRKTIDGAKVKYTDDNKTQQELTLASSVSISNTSYGEDSSGTKVYRFTLSFVYAPELFSLSSKGATVVVANEGNVTDSYLGVPKSVFADRAKDLTGSQ